MFLFMSESLITMTTSCVIHLSTNAAVKSVVDSLLLILRTWGVAHMLDFREIGYVGNVANP